MDQQRRRSPSGMHQQPHISQAHSQSPQIFPDNVDALGLGLGLDHSISGNSPQFMDGSYSNNGAPSFRENHEFFDQQGQTLSETGVYNPNSDFSSQFKQEDQLSPFGQQQQQESFTQDLLGANLPNNFEGDFSLFSTPAGPSDQYDPVFFMNDLSQTSANPSVNPGELDMSSPHQQHTPTPPHLLRPGSHSPSSAHQSPSFAQTHFQPSPGHSRNASLGPESAAFPQGHLVDWNAIGPQFQTHRRTPSEYSDVSVSSVTHSPNLGHDTFDSIDQHHSPMQNAQDAGIYQEVLGIGNFSLSDPQVHHGVNPGFSPAHSPAISPRLAPQQAPNLTQDNHYMLGVNNSFGPGPDMYASGIQDVYPQIQHGRGGGSMDIGQGPQMIPPDITVEFAPASRQNSFDPPKPALDQDALTPPDRGRRRRAASDPFNSGSVISRPRTPSSMSPGIGSEFSARSPDPARSLSPNDQSQTDSPSRRRQSTSAIPNRDYFLGLADPDYAPATAESGNARRAQRHPATFQCTLCPKRFTRAYNLRSHLRTHTDERPFVCTVCGKAFARQHDRKRHEGLHSGEKKFVCKGKLKHGGEWGCGRRFARADALGRHFRSEAGRICIKPLLDEEAIERQRLWQEQRMQNMHMQQQPQPISIDANGFPMDASGNYTLPAALLAQYPALATLSWADLPQGDVGLEDDPSGRSSFDASGSEYYDEGDDGGYMSSGPGPQQGYGQPRLTESFGGYSSDLGGR